MEKLLSEIRKCTVCSKDLHLGPNPVVTAHKNARLVIIGQAPGTKVHQSGIPWNDASGKRLREWLDMEPEQFYESEEIAIVPMGFCYPGKGKTGDLPPRPECAPLWHKRVLDQMPKVELILLIGQYAQKYYLGNEVKRNLTETVRHREQYLPLYFPTPHPSPRNRLWLRKNEWFEKDAVPELRLRVQKALNH